MLLEFNKISFDYLAGKLTLSINCTKNPDVSCEALSLPVYVFEIQLKKQKHLQKSIIPNYIYYHMITYKTLMHTELLYTSIIITTNCEASPKKQGIASQA